MGLNYIGSKILIMKIVGKRHYTIIYNFDCGHTFPSICIPQKNTISLIVNEDINITILKNSICDLTNNIVSKNKQ